MRSTASTATAGCIWCGSSGLSKEHVYPQWLRRMVAPQEHERIITETSFTDGTSTSRVKQGSVFTVRPRVVCEPCNNGWMSALESKTIPVLAPLVQGHPTRVNSDDAQVLATSAAKTAITAQYAGTEPTTTAAQRTQFMTDPRPLAGTQVHLGRFNGGQGADLWQYPWYADLGRHRRQQRDPNSHFTVMALGNLLLVVMNSPAKELRHYEPRDMFSNNAFTKAWPRPTATSWPPLLQVTVASVVDFRTAFVEGLHMA